jgi:hypothetical protein
MPLSAFRFRPSRTVFYSPMPLRREPLVTNSYDDASQTVEVPALHPLAGDGRPLSGRILRLEIVILAAIIGFGYFASRALKQQDAFQEVSLSQNRSLLNLAVSVANGNVRVNGLTKSVKDVTATLAQSSSRIGEFSNQLGQRGNQIQVLNYRLQEVETALRRAQQVRSQVPDTTTSLTTSQPPSVSPVASLAGPHSHQMDASIPMPAGALGHQNSQGELDYWLITRTLPSGERFVKVEPYGTSSRGIEMHSMSDGTDYILTPRGDWLSATESDSRVAAVSPRRRQTHRR